MNIETTDPRTSLEPGTKVVFRAFGAGVTGTIKGRETRSGVVYYTISFGVGFEATRAYTDIMALDDSEEAEEED